MTTYNTSIQQAFRKTLKFDGSRRRFSLLALLAFAVMLMTGQVSAQQTSSIGDGAPPRVGLRVLEVGEGSPAEAAGLKPMDTIVKYGDFAIVDSASYFAARDTYGKSQDAKIALVYWRGREKFESLIPSGVMGIRFNDYNPVAYELGVFITELTSTSEVPEYFLEAETAKGKMRSPERIAADARALIERATQDGTLTPAQILVARISIIPDNAPAAETEKQADLVKELLSTQPLSFTTYLGAEVFFKQKRYRPAIECFKRSLSSQPSDANARLNQGLAYINLGRFSEADDAATYVFNSRTGLTEYGLGIALQIKAAAALGRRDFARGLDYAERAFQHSPSRSYLMSLWQLAAAQNGDLEKFYQVIAASEKALPKDYINLRGRTDAVEAYILFKNNQIEKARQLVRRSSARDNLDANARYWKQYPSGDDVVKCWKELQAQN